MTLKKIFFNYNYFRLDYLRKNKDKKKKYAKLLISFIYLLLFINLYSHVIIIL